MTWFMHPKHLALIAICLGAITLAAGPATAQQPSSATLNGTIGTFWPGDHTWTLTLHGLSYSYHEAPPQFTAGKITRVYATSFDFEFQGPRATELNANVSEPLENAGLQDGPVMELRNYIAWESGSDWYDVRDWIIQVQTRDYQQELWFHSWPGWTYEWPSFATDANGYPVLAPFTFTSEYAYTSLIDNRSLPGDGYTMGTCCGTVSVTSVGFSLPGDFDNDGDVDGRDFLSWQRNPGLGDLADWQANYGAESSFANSATVPEPASVTLVTLAIAMLICRHRLQPR